jgi:hypothetical protein
VLKVEGRTSLRSARRDRIAIRAMDRPLRSDLSIGKRNPPKGEEEMKYALLVYPGPALEAIGQLSEEEQAQVMSEYRALGQEAGVYGSEQLQPADLAITVRVEDGRTLTTGGAVANEDIRGLYLLEADDIDRALELAARVPTARLGGTVEVRPIVER